MRFAKRPSPGYNVRNAGPADLNFLPINGQSLSLGVYSLPLLSTVPSSIHKMFVDGVRPQFDFPLDPYKTAYASLAPLVEAIEPDNNIVGETPASGAAQMISELLAAENPADPIHRMLMMCPGYGGTAIAGLSPGTTNYARLLQQAEYGYALAQTQGWSYMVQAQGWIQGESDYAAGTTRAAYRDALNAFANTWAAHGKVVGYQAWTPLTLVAQIASHLFSPTPTPAIALAQTDAAAVYAPKVGVQMACAMYQFDYPQSDWHLGNASSKWVGAYLGLAYKRLVYDSSSTWGALKPLTCTRNGSDITLTFNAVGQLVFDATWITAIANQGFQVYQSNGTTSIGINSVTIVGANTVVISCGSTVPAGALVNYAWQGTAGQTAPGRVTGARGTLRDSQGDTIIFDPAGINRPMHNWCLIFQKGVTN